MVPELTKGQREKCTAYIMVMCKPSEKTNWIAAFGDGEVSRKVRELMNKAAARQLKPKSTT